MPEILTFLLAVTLVGAGVYVIRRKVVDRPDPRVR